MRRRFFIEKFEEHEATVMRGETAEHLGRVLRAEPGQLYELSDTRSVWLARVETISRLKRGETEIRFALIEPVAAREPLIALHLLISLIKFDRFEWCLEKATELGVAAITPLAAARSDKALTDAAAKRSARWEKILVESAQQARRLAPPMLRPALRPSEAFGAASAARKILLSERAGAPPLAEAVGFDLAGSQSAALAIGPEGGWTDDELAAAGAAGFAEASLGDHILRAETAVIAATAVMQFALGQRPQ
jgi:16S rRNA (uracil1498-N3)-methyltransferase